ncbi:Fur family transcriptional regulator [Reichenbachiella versicolor]|uniref:Fur family transcriptional regulator n=1 Tax=Reichenbachiella versicolor TaxID=1821036 RepID=UPI000D6EA92C|nr:transcriptional repressor [Reichenbachiella versicolor]
MGVIRKTKSVNSLLKLFENSTVAISIQELLDKLGDEMNRTTVYRILDRLEDDGELHSFIGKNGAKWYSKYKCCSNTGCTQVHPHFQCTQCGKTECIDINMEIPQIQDYKIETMSILLTGSCKDCL